MTPQTLTIGYADLEKFSAFARSVGYPKALPLLQEMIQAVSEIIINHGGRIHNYLGDAVMFVFTDPKQAIAAGQAIAAYEKKTDLTPLRFLVSLATGEVFTAEIGHASRRQTEVYGETVQRAFDLHEKARTGSHGLIICEHTQKFV